MQSVACFIVHFGDLRLRVGRQGKAQMGYDSSF